MKLLPIPFAPGMDQSTDPAFMGPGQLTRVENLRPTRNGRLAKRPPSAVQSQTVGGAAIEGKPQLIGAVSQASLLGAGGVLYAETSTPTEWVEAGDLPLGTPIGMQSTGASSSAAKVCAAHQSGRLLVSVERPDSLGSPSGELRLLERETGHTWGSITGGHSAHLLTYGEGNGGLAVYIHGSTTYVTVRSIDFDSSTPSIGSTSTLISSAHSKVAATALPSGATSWYLLRLASGTLTLEQRAVADNSLEDSETVATGIGSPAYIDLAIDETRVYVTWTEPAYVKVRTYSHNLSIVGTTRDLTSSGHEQHGQPQISCPPGVGAKLVCSSYDTTGLVGRFLVVRHIATDGTASSTWPNYQSLEPVSRPFVDEGRLFCWVTNLDYETFPRYYLYQIGTDTGTTTGDNETHLIADGDAAWNASTWHPSSVYSLGDGRWGWVGRTLVKDLGGGSYQYGTIEYEFSTRPQARQVVSAGGVGLIPGGVLHEWTTAGAESPQMLSMPTIISLTAGTSGSLTPESTYTYSVIYEWRDRLGRVHRSVPANPVEITLGAGEDSVTVESSPTGFARGVRYIYRSAANGSVLYRASGGAGASYDDDDSDEDIQEREILYTEGGVLPADPAPASTFGTFAMGRVWLGGLFRRERIVCSTEQFPGEAPWYPLDGSHWLDFPSPVTGLAPLDDSLVVFTDPDIWIVSGDGPSIQGVGSFPTPRRLSTDLGCTDWRSVLPTSLGVFYRSRAGIMLLPRGGMQPIYVGHQIADVQDSYPYVLSAALHGEGDGAVARFVLADDPDSPTATQVVTYHLRAQAWSVESHPGEDVVLLGNWVRDGEPVQVLAPATVDDGVVVEESSTQAYPASALVTGEIAPFGFGTMFRVNRIWLRLANRGLACALAVKIYYDGDAAVGDELDIGLPAGGTAGDPIRREWRPRRAECQSLRIELADTQNGPASSQGVDYVGLTLEVESAGPQQLPTANRR